MLVENFNSIVISQSGGPEVLKMISQPLREPGRGEIRVRNEAMGVAYAEVLMRYRLFPGAPKIPFIPGYDIVGRIDKIGPGDSVFKVGEKVAALTVTGGYSEFSILTEEELVKVPESIDPAEAVSLVVNYVTAYQMLHRVAKVKKGDKVLIHGAAGGIGSALLQLGKLAELDMYGTASVGKHALLRENGAIPINYKSENFSKIIRKYSHKKGIDVVFDPIGGLNFVRSYCSLQRKGKLIAYGFSSSLKNGKKGILGILKSFVLLSFLKILPNNKNVKFYSLTDYYKKNHEWFREDLNILLKLLQEGKIKPIIGERLPLKEASQAHKLIESAAVSGKIILFNN